MDGILRCVRQLAEGRAELEIAYARAVRPAGNVPALTITRSVFEVIDREWRGLGVLPASGLGLRADYADFDAALRFKLNPTPMGGDEECLGGQVMLGTLRPERCPAFGNRCKPEHPLGAPMVSSEGACAAYFRFRGTVSGSGD